MADALVVQHIAIEEPFTIRAALERAGVQVHTWMAGTDTPLPALGAYDGLVVMGGPQSAYLDDDFPSRGDELALIRTAHAAGVPTLGVCLGAQMIAVALGGEGMRGDAGFECGWEPVRRTDEPDPLFDATGEPGAPVDAPPQEFPALHWHGDTFTLPPDAVRLASSDRYPNQAFRVGRAWGIQFHIEVDADAVATFCRAFGDEADVHAAGGAEAIRTQTPAALAAVGPVRDGVFDRFAAMVARHGASEIATDRADRPR